MLSVSRLSYTNARRLCAAHVVSTPRRLITTKNATTTTTTTMKKNASTSATSSTASSSSSSWTQENPFLFQLIVATAKTMGADLMTQMVAEGKSLDQVDWKRNGVFCIFGFAYLGGVQYWLMVHKYRHWFPTMDKFAKLPTLKQKLAYTAGLIDAAKMVLFDVVVHMPLMYFPVYYTVKESVTSSSFNPIEWTKSGLQKYANNAKEDLTAMVKLWGPSDCIQFMLPVHIRLPFRHVVSFFWTAYVSFTRGSIQQEQEQTTTSTIQQETMDDNNNNDNSVVVVK